jgi:hypothetical protein
MTNPLSVEKNSYPIVDFLEWKREGRLDLNPPYQRRQVWNPRLKSKLMDSILRGYPIPLIFLHNRLDVAKSRNIRQVVDGQQRLRTILSFLDPDCIEDKDEWDTFTVLRSHNSEFYGLPFDQFPDDTRERILQTPLSVNVLPGDVDDVTVLQIFQRINSTGLKLNAQELRNATFFGEFKDFSYSLSYDQHQRWISWGLFDRQKLGQMLEVEFTSDLLGLMLDGVQARTKPTIDRIYKKYDPDLPHQPELLAKFTDTFDFLDSVFKPGATTSTLRRFRTTTWLYACFAVATGADQQTLTGELRRGKAKVDLPPDPDALISALNNAERALRDEDLDPDAAKRLRGATSDKTSREERIRFLRSFL